MTGHGTTGRRRQTAVMALFALAWVSGASTRGDLVESFESIETAWKQGASDATWVISEHRRVFDEKHGGNASERIRFRVGPGTHAYLYFSAPPMRVIDELGVSVWVRSDVPGVQLLARVVFPRSHDPATGKPRTTWLRGSIGREESKWERLHLTRPREQLEARLFALRSQYGGQLDSAEAYIDLIALNVHLGPGAHTVWTDDLEIAGQVLRSDAPSRRATRPSTGADGDNDPSVRLLGDVLMVEGRPFSVRAVDHHGEILADLKSLGFNTAILPRPVTSRDEREAADAGMWLVAPLTEAPIGALADGARRSAGGDRVIAWLVPERLTAASLPRIREQIMRYRRRGDRRPVIGIVDSGFRSYGQLLDIVVLDRPVMGSTRSLEDYLFWLRLARSEIPSATPCWIAVHAELPVGVERQIVGLGGDEDALMCSTTSLETIVLRSVQQGCRGVWIRGRRSLQTPDAVTARRRLAIHRATRFLEVLEPWIAAGRVEHGIETSSREATATLFVTDRGRMMLAVRHGPGVACVPPPSKAKELRLHAPGVAATDEAYLVSWSGLERIYTRRGLGLELTVPDWRPATMVLLTQDPRVVHFVSESVGRGRQTALDETRRLYRWESDWTQATLERLRPMLRVRGEPQDVMAPIRNRYVYLEQLVRSRDNRRAFQVSWELEQDFRTLHRGYWETALQGLPSPGTSPAVMTFFGLPLHWRLVHSLNQANWSTNLLAGGDFESLEHLRRTGWNYASSRAFAGHRRVMIAYEGMRDGRGALRIESRPGTRPGGVGEPAVRITSPTISVPGGHLVRTTGWVRVEEAVQGHPDGLSIYDTLGGPELAVHHRARHPWEEVVLYRVCTEPTTMQLVIELSGRGTVVLDSFQITLTPLGL